MAGFLDWFFFFLTTTIDGIWMIFSDIFKGIVQIFNISDYLEQFNAFKGGFGVVDWIFAILALLLVIAIWGILIRLIIFGIYLIILGIRKLYELFYNFISILVSESAKKAPIAKETEEIKRRAIEEYIKSQQASQSENAADNAAASSSETDDSEDKGE